MKTVALIALALVVLMPQSLAAASTDSMTIGSVSLTLGMTHEAVAAQLAPDQKLQWQRDLLPKPVTATKSETGVRYEGQRVIDGKPVTFTYDDDHGEHAYIANASGEPLAMLVFENKKLTRATRLIGAPDHRSAPAPALLSTIAAVLENWRSTNADDITVRSSQLTSGSEKVEELVFEAGSRQLIVLSLSSGMQVVENLGRGDVPAITLER